MSAGKPASCAGAGVPSNERKSHAALGEPVAYLLHEGMGNYRAEWNGPGFDLEAVRRLDPLPLFKCPTWPHDKGLVYDAETDEGVCRLCGYRTVIEMGWA